ncbi:uncharacterized protein LOC17889764 isoform X2 [Capsella rubella]|uniref:uncharacterized protein LOC17889764 isoform X2 n=1 Tax=Capsella rubella TaxID=81985 RepID=UPI000CD510B4|nr:uncharacterized protein LOC17889764 isoform X2 [Capsella rubella]
MSPAAVEIGSPVENFTALFPESVHSHDQANMDPSFSFGFGAGSGQNTKTRLKPRLVKLRKNERKVKGTSFSGEILSGFNPFAPPSNGSLHMNSGDKCFVFGANGNSSGAKASPGNATVSSLSDEEFSTPIGDSELGSESSKKHSDRVVQKVDNESTTCDAKTGLKFDCDGNGSWKSVENPDAVKEDIYKTSCYDTCSKSKSFHFADGKTVHRDGPELNLAADLEKLNISDSRVYGGSDYEEASKSINTPVFTFGNFGKVDPKCEAATSGSCSFSSNGFHQSNNVEEVKPTFRSKTTNVNNLSNTSFSTGTSFDDFKVPVWDPSSLKNSLFPELSRIPVHQRRNRLSKDRKSKKIKEKMKQPEPDRCNDRTSAGIQAQEKLNSPENCSPMDYSPYQGEKASNQFTTETPLTSFGPSHSSKHDNSRFSNDSKVASAWDSSLFTAEDHGSSCMPKFSFSASTSQGTTPHTKLQAVKKYRRKLNKSLPKNNLNATMRNNQENQPVNTSQAKQDTGSTSMMPDVCEVWRLRGNQAYKNGYMSKAEECYTQGINSSPPSDNSEYSVKPLALCYGNRAAARISLGRLREAITDCERAASLDPTYIKAYMRAANCHLVLGELGSAVQYFNKCMESTASVCLDRRTTIEAAEGLQQAKRVADFTSCASILLEKRTPDGASDALVPIANALLISSCSDKLLQMKAEALFMIRRYKEVIELCDNTLQTAERNIVSEGIGGTTNVDRLGSTHHALIVWRWNMISKSHFYLGNLEKSLNILEKLQQVEYNYNENQEECRESPAFLVATISELLRYKNAGNEAVREGKYMEAVEQYTAALSRNVDSRPFAAICFCNRAAANQALVQIADAIADCSLAMALDENYTKDLVEAGAVRFVWEYQFLK